MIIKKIKRSGRAPKARSTSVRNQVDYITRRGKDPSVEVGSRNMVLGETIGAWREEMVAVAGASRRSAMPVDHWVMSWREDERPTRVQLEESVTVFAEELGVVEHQIIWAAHADTRNVHLHILLNRVHPETEKCVDLKFDYDLGGRAVARIEALQGWAREPNAQWVVDAEGHAQRVGRPGSGPRQRAQDFERRHGAKSAERRAIEEAAPILAGAQTWAALHDGLAGLGMRYLRKGSGAVVVVGGIPVKASAVARDATLKALEKRLGPYVSPVEGLPSGPEPRKSRKRSIPQAMPDAPPSWADYMVGRIRRAGEIRRLRARHRTEVSRLRAEQNADRDALQARLLSGTSRPRRLAAIAALTAAHREARASMRARHRAEREALAREFPPQPAFDVWLRQMGQSAEAERWRMRRRRPLALGGEWTDDGELAALEAPGFDVRRLEGGVIAYVLALAEN